MPRKYFCIADPLCVGNPWVTHEQTVKQTVDDLKHIVMTIKPRYKTIQHDIANNTAVIALYISTPYSRILDFWLILFVSPYDFE